MNEINYCLFLKREKLKAEYKKLKEIIESQHNDFKDSNDPDKSAIGDDADDDKKLAIMLEKTTEITLNRKDQVQELEEKKKSAKYIEALYKCDNCALVFEYSIHLQNHMRLHDPVILKFYFFYFFN